MTRARRRPSEATSASTATAATRPCAASISSAWNPTLPPSFSSRTAADTGPLLTGSQSVSRLQTGLGACRDASVIRPPSPPSSEPFGRCSFADTVADLLDCSPAQGIRQLLVNGSARRFRLRLHKLCQHLATLATERRSLVGGRREECQAGRRAWASVLQVLLRKNRSWQGFLPTRTQTSTPKYGEEKGSSGQFLGPFKNQASVVRGWPPPTSAASGSESELKKIP